MGRDALIAVRLLAVTSKVLILCAPIMRYIRPDRCTVGLSKVVLRAPIDHHATHSSAIDVPRGKASSFFPARGETSRWGRIAKHVLYALAFLLMRVTIRI